MHLEKDSFARNRIIPWYDSSSACWITIIFSCLVLLFSLGGIRVASITPMYEDFLWFPTMLSGMCIFLIVKSSLRLIRQNSPH